MAAKFALILATVLHDGGVPIVLSGPEIPYELQRKQFKDLAAGRVHEQYARVELVDTRRGTIKHQSFISPAEAKRRAKELARQEKEFEDSKKPPAKKAKGEGAEPPGEAQ